MNPIIKRISPVRMILPVFTKSSKILITAVFSEFFITEVSQVNKYQLACL